MHVVGSVGSSARAHAGAAHARFVREQERTSANARINGPTGTGTQTLSTGVQVRALERIQKVKVLFF